MNLSCWHLQEFYVSTKNQPVPSMARLCSLQYKPVPLCGGLVWTVPAMTSCGVGLAAKLGSDRIWNE